MKENLLEDIPQTKLYNDIAVRVGTFIGGPLVGGYLIAENFKLLGQTDKVKITWFFTIIATIVIFGVAFLLHETQKIPNYLIPVIYTLISAYIINHYQGNQIKSHIEKGGQMYSNWRALLIGLIGFLVTIVILVIILLLTDENLLSQ